MEIYVVRRGDRLNDIAKLFNVTTQSIIDTNELKSLELVTGQALVIPTKGTFYIVKPGDSLYKIALKIGITYQELARINNLDVNRPLTIGQRIYLPVTIKKRIESNAYVEPLGETVSQNLINASMSAAPYLTYLAPFSFRIARDGSLIPPLLDNFEQIARDNKTTLMMVVTNLEEGQFSAELGRIILTNDTIQNRLIDNIIETANRLGFRDIHFDMEFLPPELREEYMSFLRKAKARLKEAGILMSVALAPKTSAEQKGEWYEAHDYREVGKIADFVVLMTYEWGYSGGPPMPVSPLPQVREVVEYALTEMPASKIMLGQNLYGYDWTLPFVEGGEYAKAISPQAAIDVARRFNVPIKYNYESQAPYIEYTDENRKKHIIWFEDARSIQAKFDLIKELGLRGISYWKLGLSFPQNWVLLDDNFTIVKR